MSINRKRKQVNKTLSALKIGSRNRSNNHPILVESCTDEYRKKKNIKIEGIDHRGIFRRARVLDQTKFDELFLDEKITSSQYSAADMYLGLMSVSGCFLKSPNLGGHSSKIPGRDSAGAMASKILAISSARTRLREAGERCLVAVESCVGMNSDVNIDDLKKGLNALAKYFQTA